MLFTSQAIIDFLTEKNHKQCDQTEDYMLSRDDRDVSHLVVLQGICVITYGNLEMGGIGGPGKIL